MSNPEQVPPKEPSAFSERVNQLLRAHLRDLQSPAPEEVQNLVSELEQRRSELEMQNQELLKTQQQLEAYRDRYVDLYDFAPLGYVTLDEEGYVQEINLAGTRLLEAKRDELIGYPFASCVAKEDEQVFLEHVRKCVTERAEVVSELSLVVRGGRTIAVQLRSIPISEPQMHATLCKTAMTDITERKRAEESLKQERNLLRTLIDNLPDCVYVKDSQSRFIAANLAVARIMGAATPSDLLGKTDREFYPANLAAEYLADEQEILRSKQPLVDKDEPHVDPIGSPRVILTTKVPFKDSQGNVVGLVGISRDITARKQAEEEVRQAQQRVLELQQREKELVEAELSKARDALVRQTRLAAVGQLSVSIAHDLRNPLGGIRNAVYLLKRKISPLEAKCHEYLKIIEDELVTANEVITDCLAISQGRAPIKRPVALLPILTQARCHVAAGEQIQWRYILPSEPFLVCADASQLEQVFKNLFLNAMEALGESGTIMVEAAHVGGYDEILVGDDGPGVRQDVRDRIFEPLVTTKPRGTGLGLTICRQIIEQHGGTIELLAADQPGTSLQIRLPAGEA
jgi:PAS domain S-box-containing protein